MPAIIAEKQIVVKAIDKVSEPLARMDSSLASFVSKFGSLDSHMTQAATSQSTFRGALQQTRASLQETSTSATKLSNDIAHIKSKKVDIKANTTEANTKISDFDKNVKKLQPPVIKPKVDSSQATNGLNKINEKGKEVEKTGHSITKSFVFGNIISNGITSIAGHLGEWTKQGYEAAKAGTELTERWSNLGMSRKEIQATGQAILQIKTNSNLSGNAASELVTRMYGFTGSAKQARTLAFGVATIADKMKMTTGQADSFAQSLTRIETAGNVSTRSLGRLERSAPGITKALQQASGMSAKAFNQLLSSGKMTSQQFNDILARASKNWDKYSSDWNKTADGALHHIQQSWQATKKSLMAPLVQSSATGLSALSKALDKLQPQFKQLGVAIGKMANSFAKWLTPKHAEDLGKIVSSLGKMVGVIGKGVWRTFSGIIQIIGKAFGAVSGHHDGLDATADALDHISKNKAAMTILQGIGMVLATQFAYGKLFKMASGLGLINDGLTLLGKHKLSGNIFKSVTKGLSKLTKIKIDPHKWFVGGKNWAKGLFKEAPEEALRTGDKAGGNFITRFASKTNASKFARVGRSLGGRIISGVGLALEAYDFVKDIMGAFTKKNANARYQSAGKAVGAGLGAGIGFFFGDPAGAALGGMIGRAIGGHLGPSFAKFGKGTAKLLGDIFVKHDWNKVWSDIGKGWKSFWKGMGDWWNKLWGKPSKSSTSSKEIKSLGGNHYSKADIANIKEMNRAVRSYIRTLKTLKSTVKHNDPTKELNRMNDHLKSFTKNLSKSAKPLKSVSKTFKTFGNATKKMASSIKTLTGKHGLGEFSKDLKSLNTTMKKVKLDTYFEKLAKSIKKSKLASEFKSLTKSLKSMVKEWKGLEKPLKNNEKALTEFEKIVKKLTDKKTGLKALDTDIIDLSKDLRKYDFGKSLSRQMAEANKAVGKHGFVKEFSLMVKTVESDLKSFKKTFDNDWGRIWKNLDRDVSRGLRSALRAEDSGMDSMRSKESHFTSSFKKSWSNWLDDLVSAMRSAFDKLPGIAGKAMSGIVSRLNKGINGINKAIGDFGGDKKLGTISYARGTFAHPGGKAIVNDALTPNKTELIYQPSRGWGFARGQNVVRDLEAGSMVLDAQHSAPILKRLGMPHYADGTLSDDEMDKIAEAFEKNAVAASKQLMLKLTNWSSSVPIVPSLGKAETIGLSRGIANVLKDLLGEVKQPKNGDWTPVIRSAAAHMGVHLSAYDIKRILNTINHESRGSQTVVNGWDSNAAKGTPSIGLLQFIQPTFDQYAVRGHHNIRSGYDQLLALFNDSNWRGDLRWNGGWGPSGGRVRAANGAHFTSMTNALVGDNPEHDEYVINPYNASSVSLMKDAWRDMENAHPELRQDTSSANFNSQVVGLLKTVVSTIKSIDFAPEVNVDTMRKAINKQNAIDYRLM